jgi:hypothetical protein
MMRLDRWKTACAKLQVAMCDICGYDTAVSGGERRRSRNTGEVKCIRNSLLSHWQQLCWQDVTHLVKRLALVQALALQAQHLLVVIPWLELLLVQALPMPVKLATSVTNTPISASTRSSEIFKGMPHTRGLPFCLPKA